MLDSHSFSDIAVIILAAGKGTRMHSDTPKVLHPIANQPMIEHVIATAQSLSPKHIISVIGPDMDVLNTVIDRAMDAQQSYKTVIQKEQLGTGHAVQQALAMIPSDFDGHLVVLYGDTPFISKQSVDRMMKRLNTDVKGTVVLGFHTDQPNKYGRLIRSDHDMLDRIVEYKDADESQRCISLCNSGVMAASFSVFRQYLDQLNNNNASNEYYLTDLVAITHNAGLSSGYVEAEEQEVMGINDKHQLAYAEFIFQQHLRHQAMQQGVTLIAPETIFLSKDTQLGRDVIIHPHVVIRPGVSIDSHVTIKSFSHLEQCHIQQDAVIGPYARIRPGCHIGKDAHIGNFVEIKNANIGQNSKIGHLSYIGDTDIGNNSNIGAGTITCNYNGYEKFRTTIGDACFVGSNSIFIAPVTIGNESLTAAGSVISEDVDSEAMAIERGKQVNIQGKATDLKKRFAKKASE